MYQGHWSLIRRYLKEGSKSMIWVELSCFHLLYSKLEFRGRHLYPLFHYMAQYLCLLMDGCSETQSTVKISGHKNLQSFLINSLRKRE